MPNTRQHMELNIRQTGQKLALVRVNGVDLVGAAGNDEHRDPHRREFTADVFLAHDQRPSGLRGGCADKAVGDDLLVQVMRKGPRHKHGRERTFDVLARLVDGGKAFECFSRERKRRWCRRRDEDEAEQAVRSPRDIAVIWQVRVLRMPKLGTMTKVAFHEDGKVKLVSLEIAAVAGTPRGIERRSDRLERRSQFRRASGEGNNPVHEFL